MNNEFLILRQELWAVIPLAPSHLSTTQNLEKEDLGIGIPPTHHKTMINIKALNILTVRY